MRQLLEKILEKIKKTPGDYQAYEDLYFMCIDAMKEDRWLSVEFLKKLSEECEKAIKENTDEEFLKKIFDLHKRALLKAAPLDFDSYLDFISSSLIKYIGRINSIFSKLLLWSFGIIVWV